VQIAPAEAAALADAVLYLHAAFVSFVVGGQILILLGWRLDWRFTRNPGFRWTHLAAIVYVAGGSALGLVCPLTAWENHLRGLAAQAGYRRGFIADRVSGAIFYHAPDWVFPAAYGLFAALVAYCFFRYPPRGRVPKARGR
jgi:hypothetical protein